MRVGLIALMVACQHLIAGCSKETPYKKPPVPVKIQAVEAALLESGLKFSAILTPREQVDVAFKVGGYVQEILQLGGPDGKLRDVQKGDQIVRGSVLAKLRDSDYQAKLHQATAAVEEARASLAQASREFERADRLFQEKAVSKDQYEKAKEKLEVTKARTGGAGSQLDEAGIQLQDTELRSPLNGVLVSRLVERGTLVAPGTRAFLLADLSSVKAVFGVPDHVLKLIRPGNPLTVIVEALHSKEFQGIVTAVSPSADPKSRVFEVEITVLNPDAQLKDGMIATVRLGAMAAEKAVPVVPLNAIVRPPGESQGYMVYVLEERDGKPVARGRKVTVGKMFGSKLAIAEGLSVGDMIVTTGATVAYDGAPVDVIP